jgi:uncharacterized protein YcfL
VKGFKFTIFPMKIAPGGRVNDIFVNDSRSNGEILELPQQQHVVYNKETPIEELAADHYYQPTYGTQPSFDSFIYDPHKSRITTFQVSVGDNHKTVLKGFNDLRQLAISKKLNVTLRLVLVVPEGHQVRCPVPMTKDFVLEMYSLEVGERDLYGED